MRIALDEQAGAFFREQFDSEAEEEARFYVSVFRNARMGRINRYGEEGFEIHRRPEGSAH